MPLLLFVILAKDDNVKVSQTVHYMYARSALYMQHSIYYTMALCNLANRMGMASHIYKLFMYFVGNLRYCECLVKMIDANDNS